MTDPLKHTLSYDDAAPILARGKIIRGNVEWRNEPANGVFFTAYFSVLDELEAGIPGLTIELHYRRGLVRSQCNFKFTLFQLSGADKRRAYQLQVIPPDRWKHRHRETGKPLYGPHEHFGMRTVAASSGELGCEHHRQWFGYFLSATNIRHIGDYSDPDPPPLIRDLFDPDR